jgi:hypothetical protein
MKTIAATALTAALGLGSLIAATGPAGPSAPRHPSPSAEREIILGHGSCVWGAFSVLGHHVVILERCAWEEDGDT